MRKGSKIFHLEYKHKAGRKKHSYYTALTQLTRYNPDIRVSLSTLQHFNFKDGNVYENDLIFIYLGELVDKTMVLSEKKARSK